MPTQEEYNTMSDAEKKKEDWMNSKWRPAMGWLYMLVCFCDFVLFPVLWSMLHAVLHTQNAGQWNPLTLQGAGLFHLAMGAVLGLAAWGRTQEKLNGANNGGAAPSGGFGAPATGGFSSPASGGFGSPSPAPVGTMGFGASTTAPSTGFGAPAPAPIATNASGKKVVPQFEQPVL